MSLFFQDIHLQSVSSFSVLYEYSCTMFDSCNRLTFRPVIEVNSSVIFTPLLVKYRDFYFSATVVRIRFPSQNSAIIQSDVSL